MTDETSFHAEQRREIARAVEQARADALAGLVVWYSLGFICGGGVVAAAFAIFG